MNKVMFIYLALNVLVKKCDPVKKKKKDVTQIFTVNLFIPFSFHLNFLQEK